MTEGEDAPSWWERLKRYWRGRRASGRVAGTFSAGIAPAYSPQDDPGAAIADLASRLDRRGDRYENAGDFERAATLFQAANRVRESGSLEQAESIARRTDPLNFGGALFGFSAGDRSDPQASDDPGPFVDPGTFSRARPVEPDDS